MGLSTFATILLFLVCLAGGIAIGFLLARYLKSAADVAEGESIEQEPVKREVLFTKPQEPALLQIRRTKKKALSLEMAGQRWENPGDLPGQSRKELTAIVKELGAWVEPAPAPLPDSEAYEPKPAKNSLFSRSYSPGKQPKNEPSQPAKLASPGAPVSMVTQIDAILPQKLVGTPFSNLDIHLIERPTRAVHVQVGAIKHPAVDSIPTPAIQELIRQAGLPEIRFHDLRHTAATLLLNHGVPPIVVSRRLGHYKVSMTLDIYGHLMPEIQDTAAKLIDELITPVEIKLHHNCTIDQVSVKRPV